VIRLVLEAITAWGIAIAEALGLASKRSDLNNAQDVKAAAKAQSEEDEVTKDVQTVKEQNIEEFRKRISE
jgi:hypothetical protein